MPVKKKPMSRNIENITTSSSLERILSDMDNIGSSSKVFLEVWNPDIRAIRKNENVAMTQREFAQRYGLGFGNVRNWEQGISVPTECSRTLLWLIERHPKLILSLLERSDVILSEDQ
ncbi:hypothetical protein A8B75_19140 [Sphingomonadales bacterium EhC05]|nr:hypothetical protein A8B75_19140 [Sphingomonadales bacterium EhC05]